MSRKELHALVGLLPEEAVGAAKDLLEGLLRAGSGFGRGQPEERAILLEQVLDYLPDATLAVDREGKVLVWNRAAEQMTGLKQGRNTGEGWLRLRRSLPGKLLEEEWKEVKRHPEIGYRIALSSPELAPVAELILQCRERWDGTGYPQGLRAEGIHSCAGYWRWQRPTR